MSSLLGALLYLSFFVHVFHRSPLSVVKKKVVTIIKPIINHYDLKRGITWFNTTSAHHMKKCYAALTAFNKSFHLNTFTITVHAGPASFLPLILIKGTLYLLADISTTEEFSRQVMSEETLAIYDLPTERTLVVWCKASQNTASEDF